MCAIEVYFVYFVRISTWQLFLGELVISSMTVESIPMSLWLQKGNKGRVHSEQIYLHAHLQSIDSVRIFIY